MVNNVFSNSNKIEKEQFANRIHAYMLFGDYQQEFYPNEVEENDYLIPIYAINLTS